MVKVVTILLALTAASAVVGAAAGAAEDQPPRPNFLFIYTDDQRWDALAVVQREQGERGRFPWFETPHLDRLAAEGVRFRNAFVTLALCAPSRAAFLTGRYNHANGVVNNHTPFPTDSITWATELRRAGYFTGYVGKWHMGNQRGQRPGFDFSASFVGQGKYFDCPIEVNGTSTPSKGWVDDVSTDYALEFIKQNKAQPFALVLGFKTCHGPFTPPERAHERFAGKTVRPVPNLDVPAVYKTGAGDGSKRARAQKTGPAASAKSGTALQQLRGLSAVDENVGRLLAALDDLGLAKNTVVVYTSDNGYYLGEHGLGDKRTAYEESMRVPMIVRWPARVPAGKALDQIVLNVDVAPTFLQMAGLPVPPSMHGRSWLPLFAGNPKDWRSAFLFSYVRERGFDIPTTAAVRTETAKLIQYPGHADWTEVFDLKNDPYETKNLASDPAQKKLRAELEAAFAREAKAVGFVVPSEAEEPATGGAPDDGGVVLDYRFDRDDATKVVDASGKNNHGTAKDAPIVDGAKGRRFNGNSHIAVPKSSSLDPAVDHWTVEVSVAADRPDGVLVAQGGATAGYCLSLEGGRAVFTVNGDSTPSRVATKNVVGSNRTTLQATISRGGISLSVNGASPETAPLLRPIGRPPKDTLQIGNDLASPVVSDPKPVGFSGVVESVRITSRIKAD